MSAHGGRVRGGSTDDARCWRCEGTGMIQYEDPSGTYTHHELCPKCQGTGRPQRPSHPTAGVQG